MNQRGASAAQSLPAFPAIAGLEADSGGGADEIERWSRVGLGKAGRLAAFAGQGWFKPTNRN